jgi:hypothetical protein
MHKATYRIAILLLAGLYFFTATGRLMTHLSVRATPRAQSHLSLRLPGATGNPTQIQILRRHVPLVKELFMGPLILLFRQALIRNDRQHLVEASRDTPELPQFLFSILADRSPPPSSSPLLFG